MTDFDNEVRLHIYQRLLAEGRPPTAAEAADALAVSEEDATGSYLRLAAQRVIVLAPGSTAIWMANPLSAHPTSYWVETPRGGYFGNCISDGFGVIAMLGGTGTVQTSCPATGAPMAFSVDGWRLEPAEAVVHFAVPARRWWENIGFT